MHVLQWIAVEADDVDEAFRTVGSNLEDMIANEYSNNAWFDWFVVGGGRWNVSEGDDSMEAYKENKTNLVIHAGSDPDRFEERVLLSMEARKAEFDRYVEQADLTILPKIIADYNPRELDFANFSQMYGVKKILDMVSGEWDFNSYFYDMHNQSVTPKYLFEAIDTNPDVWYLVPVDFHF